MKIIKMCPYHASIHIPNLSNLLLETLELCLKVLTRTLPLSLVGQDMPSIVITKLFSINFTAYPTVVVRHTPTT